MKFLIFYAYKTIDLVYKYIYAIYLFEYENHRIYKPSKKSDSC